MKDFSASFLLLSYKPGHFLATNCSGREIFVGAFLSYLAEYSAIWQQCIRLFLYPLTFLSAAFSVQSNSMLFSWEDGYLSSCNFKVGF
jgi:hypothetical protein